MLETDPAARERVQSPVPPGLSARLLPAAQAQVRDFIASSWQLGRRDHHRHGWSCASGKDLQFVRVNGTLVGFLVGGALYCRAARRIWSWAAF